MVIRVVDNGKIHTVSTVPICLAKQYGSNETKWTDVTDMTKVLRRCQSFVNKVSYGHGNSYCDSNGLVFWA